MEGTLGDLLALELGVHGGQKDRKGRRRGDSGLSQRGTPESQGHVAMIQIWGVR